MHDDSKIVAVIRLPLPGGFKIRIVPQKSDLFWWKLAPGMKARLKAHSFLEEDFDEEEEGYITTLWGGIPPLYEQAVKDGRKCRRPSCYKKPWFGTPFAFCSRQCKYPGIPNVDSLLASGPLGIDDKPVPDAVVRAAVHLSGGVSETYVEDNLRARHGVVRALNAGGIMKIGGWEVQDVKVAAGVKTKVLVVERLYVGKLVDAPGVGRDIVSQFEQWLWFYAEEQRVPHILLYLDSVPESVKAHQKHGYNVIEEGGLTTMYKLMSLGRRVDPNAPDLQPHHLCKLHALRSLETSAPAGKDKDPNFRKRKYGH